MATKNKVLAFLLLVFLSIFSSKLVLAETLVANSVDQQVEAKKMDNRAKILAQYLANFNSPLQYHAQDFIDAANTYKLDWKLVPAIAGVESTFGKQIPGGFNAWGWGVYGNQAIYFNSWKEGIFTIAKGLREGYLDKGLDNPYSINRIYATSPFWGSRVTYFMQDLEKFANNFEDNSSPKAVSLEQNPNIAAVSGQLALR